jgi:pimeloyl-ACP methyl ester carboxylesterase
VRPKRADMPIVVAESIFYTEKLARRMSVGQAMKRIGRLLGLALLGIVLVLATLKLTERHVAPPGKMVDVGGLRMRIECTGPETPQTVILESGATGLAANYYWLQQGLSQHVRTCSYDRVGTAWSDDVDAPHDAQHFSKQLHALLQAANVKPPYVLAGHSLGGIVIRVYANDYPSEVAGLVFLDSSHPDQVAKLPQPEAKSISPGTIKALLMSMQIAAATGMTHIYNLTGGDMEKAAWFQSLPPERQEQLMSLTHRAQSYKGMGEEMRSLEDSFRQGGQVKTLGNLPLLVISAGDIPSVPGISEQWLRDFLVAVGSLHEDLATLSSRGRRIVLPGNHMSLVVQKDNAAKVVAAMLDFVREAATARPLQ